MPVFELVRKSSSRGPGPKSDLRVFATKESGSKGRSSVGIRVSEPAMKRLRWLVGDFVTASFDDASFTWTIRRVADERGNRLSGQGKKDGCGTVRFAVDESDLPSLSLSLGSGYDCVLVSCDGESAVFRVT